MTANRGRGTPTYETVLGTLGFQSGRHYWEIKIDAYGHEEDIFLGVSKQDVKLSSHGVESGSTWGWTCTSGKKMWPAGDRVQTQSYGDYSKLNEVIGVLLEFRVSDGVGSLSFFRNGTSLGKAFENIPPGMYFPCISMFNNEATDVQISLQS